MSDTSEILDYPTMVDEAMRGVVRQALYLIDTEGLSGDHHFFVSFNTQYHGVRLSPQLMEQYPEEMTIVMQHQFWDLVVEEDFFSLMLSFNNIPEKLVIPYDALTAFADPSVKFGLQFHEKPNDKSRDNVPSRVSTTSFEDLSEAEADNKKTDTENNVISIDAFRKN